MTKVTCGLTLLYCGGLKSDAWGRQSQRQEMKLIDCLVSILESLQSFCVNDNIYGNGHMKLWVFLNQQPILEKRKKNILVWKGSQSARSPQPPQCSHSPKNGVKL